MKSRIYCHNKYWGMGTKELNKNIVQLKKLSKLNLLFFVNVLPKSFAIPISLSYINSDSYEIGWKIEKIKRKAKFVGIS